MATAVRGQAQNVVDRVYRWARLRSRRRKAQAVARFVRDQGIRSVLFVGVGQGWESLDLVVERAAATFAPVRVACDLHATHNLPWTYVRADGLSLPFRDDAFDLVMSNAVIEHVGGPKEQARFLAEHMRVGRHWLLTTPNRWYPVEPHTKAVLLHWSRRWRERRPEAFTRLLSHRELAALLPAGSRIQGRGWAATFVATDDT